MICFRLFVVLLFISSQVLASGGPSGFGLMRSSSLPAMGHGFGGQIVNRRSATFDDIAAINNLEYVDVTHLTIAGDDLSDEEQVEFINVVATVARFTVSHRPVNMPNLRVLDIRFNPVSQAVRDRIGALLRIGGYFVQPVEVRYNGEQ